LKTVLDFTAPWQAGAARLQHGFGEPERILQAHAPEDVPAVLEAVQQAAEQGLWCVGWLAYEAAAALTGPMPRPCMQRQQASRWPGSACTARRWQACGQNPPVLLRQYIGRRL
jgi:para-aminobenzoate synthetase component 1/para-aminobenzoate synthetase/4-amino-4-deoxychorismate lyase